MKRIVHIALGGILLLMSVVTPLVASAISLVPCGLNVDDPTECGFCHLFLLIQRVFRFITFTLAAPLSVVFFLVGGLMLILAGASTTAHARAKSILTGTLIGLLVILLSWVIVSTVINILAGVDQPSGFPWPWYEARCGL